MDKRNGILERKRLYCTKCRAWTEHRVYLLAEKVLCLGCGDERRANLGELASKPPEIKTLRSGGPEKRV